MLSLKKDKDFTRVFKTGKAHYGRLLGLRAVKNGERHNRLGIIISAKISKKAVIRNRIRRRLREIFKDYDPGLKQGFDLAVVAKNDIVTSDFKELREAVAEGLKKINLFKD